MIHISEYNYFMKNHKSCVVIFLKRSIIVIIFQTMEVDYEKISCRR